MPRRHTILMGASAGGIGVFKSIRRYLPRDLPAAIFLVLHATEGSLGLLPDILNRAGKLLCCCAQCPDLAGPCLRRARRSAAYAPRTRDRARTGTVRSLMHCSDQLLLRTELASLAWCSADFAFAGLRIGTKLMRLVNESVEAKPELIVESKSMKDGADLFLSRVQRYSGEVGKEEFVRFRCRVGHTYSPENLHADQNEAVEKALWAAIPSGGARGIFRTARVPLKR